jgi:alpha-L-rhamnosidase
MKLRIAFLTAILVLFSHVISAQSVVRSLTVDYKTDPIGIDNPVPRLSWIIHSEQPNTTQQTYEIRTALDRDDLQKGRRLLWETGELPSSQSIHVPYAGPPLHSFQQVYWQVRIRDNHGKRSPWSEVASWEMGFLMDAAWEAQWISPAWKEDTTQSQPSPYLRKEFKLEKPVLQARLYITCQGLYQAEINGKRVGDQEFTPGWTSYDTRLQYQTYDVTGHLEGENAIGIILGDGWFRGNLGWVDNRNIWGSRLAALAQLRVTYTDGSVEILGTDGSWKASTGPIRSSDIYNGEVFDATLEMPGWNRPGFDDGGWSGVEILDIPYEKLISPEGPPVRVVDVLEPLIIERVGADWRVDMGQNMVGWIQIKATGKRGDVLTLRHAEVLDKEGNMYYENLRSAKATDTYTLNGGGEEVFEPHFTFQGFRFVQISGYPGELTADKIRGMVIHSDMGRAGSFSCSDTLINQLQHNIVWGLKGNFLDVPTDCPQRDERLGWTGDAQVFAPTACFNMHAANFYSKWLKDLAADQKPDGMIPQVVPNILEGGGSTGWADAGVVIPWVVYLNYGDVQILENQYESMRSWIGYMEQHAGEDLIWQEEDWHWGDWLAYDASQSDYMGAYTTKDLIATAYFAYSSRLVSKIAAILGREADARYFADLSDRIRTAFNREYVTPNGRLVSHTQTAYTLALAFDLLNEETALLSAEHLGRDVKHFGHITTGFLGTPLISLTLTEYGMNDLAYLLLNRREYPSWLYPVTMGATTIWERWDGQKPDSTFQNPGMNSFNHYAYGAIGKWLYQVVAGIGTDEAEPGYKHIVIHPRPGGGLTEARATHESMYGTIVSGWKVNGAQLEMEVEIPVNTSGSIHVPGTPSAIMVNGTPLAESGLDVRTAEGETIIEGGSGRYLFLTTPSGLSE